MAGYLKLFRKMLDWEWYNDLNTRALFLHCLLKANWTEATWRGQTIERGEFVTSLPALAEEVGLSVQQIRTALKKLKETGELSDRATTKYRIITVKNYEAYQAEQQTNAQANNRQTNRQITDNQQTEIIDITSKNGISKSESNRQITDNATSNQQTTQQQKKKRRREEEKNIYIRARGELGNVKLTDAEITALIAKHGKEKVEEAIAYLDKYIADKGYKTKSSTHNLAMQRWVFDAVEEQRRRRTRAAPPGNRFHNFTQRENNDLDRLQHQLAREGVHG